MTNIEIVAELYDISVDEVREIIEKKLFYAEPIDIAEVNAALDKTRADAAARIADALEKEARHIVDSCDVHLIAGAIRDGTYDQ